MRRSRKPLSVVRRIEGSNPSPSAFFRRPCWLGVHGDHHSLVRGSPRKSRDFGAHWRTSSAQKPSGRNALDLRQSYDSGTERVLQRSRAVTRGSVRRARSRSRARSVSNAWPLRLERAARRLHRDRLALKITTCSSSGVPARSTASGPGGRGSASRGGGRSPASATGSSPASTRGTSGPATAPAGAKVRAVVRRERVRVHGAAAGESALGESRADGSRRQHAVVFRLIGHHEGVGLRALVRLCPTFPMLTAKRRGTAARAVAAPRRARSRPRGSAPSCGRPGLRTRAPTPSRSR